MRSTKRALDPKGGESVVGYSGDKISFFRDPANRTTSFEFNGSELLSTTFPDSTQKFFEYQGPAGLHSKECNQRSFATSYEYNIWERLSKITRPDATSVSSTETLMSTIANDSSASTPSSQNKSTSLFFLGRNYRTRIASSVPGLLPKICRS